MKQEILRHQSQDHKVDIPLSKAGADLVVSALWRRWRANEDTHKDNDIPSVGKLNKTAEFLAETINDNVDVEVGHDNFGSHLEQQNHVVFVKVHKAASSTMHNILTEKQD